MDHFPHLKAHFILKLFFARLSMLFNYDFQKEREKWILDFFQIEIKIFLWSHDQDSFRFIPERQDLVNVHRFQGKPFLSFFILVSIQAGRQAVEEELQSQWHCQKDPRSMWNLATHLAHIHFTQESQLTVHYKKSSSHCTTTKSQSQRILSKECIVDFFVFSKQSSFDKP